MAILPWSSATLLVNGTDLGGLRGFRWVDLDGLLIPGPVRRAADALPGQPGEAAETGVEDAFDFTVTGRIEPKDGSGNLQEDDAGYGWLCENLGNLYAVVKTTAVAALTRRLPTSTASNDTTAVGYLTSLTLARVTGDPNVTPDMPFREVIMTWRNASGSWT
jgi:hypothetical protein